MFTTSPVCMLMSERKEVVVQDKYISIFRKADHINYFSVTNIKFRKKWESSVTLHVICIYFIFNYLPVIMKTRLCKCTVLWHNFLYKTQKWQITKFIQKNIFLRATHACYSKASELPYTCWALMFLHNLWSGSCSCLTILWTVVFFCCPSPFFSLKLQ